MQALIYGNIYHLAEESDPETVLHPTSIDYILTLLKPFAQELEPMMTLASIQEWIDRALPETLAVRVKANMIVTVKEEAKKFITIPKFILMMSKAAIITYLAVEIIERAIDEIQAGPDDYMVLPWDIQAAIGHDEELSKVFGITKDNNRLPVEVTIGPKEYTHELTQEFTVGLLLFSDRTVGNRDFGVRMFGSSFPSDYIVPTDRTLDGTRFGFDEAKSHYSVIVNGVRYGFKTPDFMQGFATGAMWAGVDHHAYWKDLIEYTDRHGDVTAQRLNF